MRKIKRKKGKGKEQRKRIYREMKKELDIK